MLIRLIIAIVTILALRSCTKAYTLTDLNDVACAKDCEHRDYTNGFSLPQGGCRCFDDFKPSTLAKPFVTVPTSLRGKVVFDHNRFYRDLE